MLIRRYTHTRQRRRGTSRKPRRLLGTGLRSCQPLPPGRPHRRLVVWSLVCAAPSAQSLEEADQLADRIAVLDQGRIVAEGTPAELKSRIPGGHVRLHFADPHLLHSASELLPAAAPDQDQLVLQVPADGTVDSL